MVGMLVFCWRDTGSADRTAHAADALPIGRMLEAGSDGAHRGGALHVRRARTVLHVLFDSPRRAGLQQGGDGLAVGAGRRVRDRHLRVDAAALFARLRCAPYSSRASRSPWCAFSSIGWARRVSRLLLVAQVLHAATFGSFHAAAIGYVHRLFRGRHQARGQAIYGSLAFGVGGALGALASGYAWDHLGAALTFTLAAGAALAGMFLLYWKLQLKEP